MNKSDLVEIIATVVDLPKATATRALDAVIDGITDALRKDDQVALLGFGTFSVKERPERKGRNPRTGEEITIKASRVPNFKAGKALKDAVASEVEAETN